MPNGRREPRRFYQIDTIIAILGIFITISLALGIYTSNLITHNIAHYNITTSVEKECREKPCDISLCSNSDEVCYAVCLKQGLNFVHDLSLIILFPLGLILLFISFFIYNYEIIFKHLVRIYIAFHLSVMSYLGILRLMEIRSNFQTSYFCLIKPWQISEFVLIIPPLILIALIIFGALRNPRI